MTQITTSHRVASSLLDAAREAGLPQPTSILPTPDLAQAVITWTPDLTGPQLTTLASLERLALSATLITPAERATLEAAIDGLRTYRTTANGSITNVQSINAIKAIIDLLRAILRDP